MSATRGDGRIGAAALERFARRGYAQTTLADIADGAGMTEAQLQDEFASTDALVAYVAAPLLDRLAAMVSDAEDGDTRDPLEAAGVLEAYLGALVDHRRLVEVVLGDPTAASCPAVSRLRAGFTALRDVLAGPAGGLPERIRASSALGALHQAVADFTDAELLTTRGVVIDAAVAILIEDRS